MSSDQEPLAMNIPAEGIRAVDEQIARAVDGDRNAIAELAESPSAQEFISNHRVGPLLGDLGMRIGVEGPHGATWKTALFQTTARRLALNHGLEQVGAVLNGAAIPWLPLKGMGLPPGTYRRLETRPTTDLDVLVRPIDLEQAVAHLRVAGWRDVHAGSLSWKALVEEGYNWQAVGPVPIMLELHFRLWGSIHESFVAELFGRAAPDPRRGPHALIIDPIDAAIIAAVHVWQTPVPRPMLFFLDLHLLVSQIMDNPGRTELVERSSRAGLQLFVALSMGCVAALWPSDQTAQLAAALSATCGPSERRLMARCGGRHWDQVSLGSLVMARLLDRRPSRTGWKAPWRSVWPHPGTLADHYPTIDSRTRRRLTHILDLARRPSRMTRGGRP